MALVDVIPEMGARFGYLLRVSRSSRLGLARGSGTATGATRMAIAWLLVEGGHGEIDLDGRTVHIEGREDVFDGPGWSLVLAPKTAFSIRGALRYTIVWRAHEQAIDGRLVPPEEVREHLRGSGPTQRTTRSYVAEGPLVCGETVVGPGGWSAWPPHRHAEEQASLYRFDPSGGFGIQVFDSREGHRRADVVYDGRARRIRAGFHPVAASPAARMYQLWVLATDDGAVRPELDPDFA